MTSPFIAYFDESGDHGLQSIDPTYPAFVLCGAAFKTDQYRGTELNLFSKIKFDHFGHDAVIFHSREIRKRMGAFQILNDPGRRARFMGDVATFFGASTCTLIAAGIDKLRHVRQYAYPGDPYGISLTFCLERLYAWQRDNGAANAETHCVFEARGDEEDKQLAVHFLRICGGDNNWGRLPFHMTFASKQTNMPGLQIADLAAYPIARYVIDRNAPNPAFEAIRPRFRKKWNGVIDGWGLKIFP